MTDVSSTASCSSAPASVMSSSPRSERIIATPSGWAMYGSPDRRTWSRCASRATSYASSISVGLALGRRRCAPTRAAAAARRRRSGGRRRRARRRGASHRSPACGRGSRRAGRGRAGSRARARTRSPTTSPPSRSTSRAVAAAVPPVAITSSTTSTCSPGAIASRWISSRSVPYSSSYSSRSISHGSFPGLRTGHEAGVQAVRHRRREHEAARLDPDAPCRPGSPRTARPARRPSPGTRRARPSSGVMSLKTIPGFG